MKLKDLSVSPENVRKTKDEEEELKSLRDSIEEHQLISRLILRKNKKGGQEIVAGQRRYYALLELYGDDYDLPETDYVSYEDLSDEQALLLSLQENQFRKDLSPMELNKAAVELNHMGKKDGEIAKILNVTPHRLKRLYNLSTDLNKMPDKAKEELNKPLDRGLFNDAHWQKVRDVEEPEIIKDVVDMICEKELPPRDVPLVIKGVQKQYADQEANKGPADKPEQKPYVASDEESGPMEYAHKGELVLIKENGVERLVVKGKREDEDVPVDHYLEFLRYPEKFKCYVTFKLKIKPVD